MTRATTWQAKAAKSTDGIPTQGASTFATRMVSPKRVVVELGSRSGGELNSLKSTWRRRKVHGEFEAQLARPAAPAAVVIGGTARMWEKSSRWTPAAMEVGLPRTPPMPPVDLHGTLSKPLM